MRKFITEFGVHMFGNAHAILQQPNLESNQLSEFFPQHNPCHIYMVGRRSRLTIIPDDVRCANSRFEGDVTIQDGPLLRKVPFSVSWRDGLAFSSQYPFNWFSFSENGKVILEGRTALLVPRLGPQFKPYLDFEVLYIGQAYGEDGNRTARERLQTHSTLQKIYSEAISRTPDKEVWLALWSFMPNLIMSFDGQSKIYGTTTEEDDAHTEKVLNTEITEQQQINFTEAALIRYFQPKYNKIFKHSFPNPAHETYSECYDLDVNSVSVELNTEQSFSRLWSMSVEPRWIHQIVYPLHSKSERAAMFEFDFLSQI